MNNSKRIGVFLDDVKVPDQMPPYIDEWVVTSTMEEFIKCIESLEQLPTLISFDGCLSTEQEIYMAQGRIGPILYTKFKQPYGLMCAKWLTEYCMNKGIKLTSRLTVHEPFPRMNSDIEWWLSEFQKKQGISPTVFSFKWLTKTKETV